MPYASLILCEKFGIYVLFEFFLHRGLEAIQMDTFTEINANSVQEFLEKLLHSESIPDDGYRRSIWRGVGDADRHTLVPSALRQENKRFFKNLQKQASSIFKGDDQEYSELLALSNFYRRANDQALQLPQLPDEWHSLLVSTPDSHLTNSTYLSSVVQNNWPPIELGPTIGLAQHYGVPTRLLDWTSDALIAAYFAAKSGLNRIHGLEPDNNDLANKGKIAVWQAFDSVFPTTVMVSPGNGKKTMGIGKPVDLKCRIHLIDAPYRGNPNLAAQKGRFTFVSVDKGNNDISASTPMDRVLKYVFDERKKGILTDSSEHSGVSPPGHLKKITLQLEDTPDLFKWLIDFGYDASRLFPGFQGCNEAIRERLLCHDMARFLEK